MNIRSKKSKFSPEHKENRMKHEGDVNYSREFYFKNKPSNLLFLLKKRYDWMNNYIKKEDKVLEIGCGIGVSRDFIRKDCDFLMTDFADFKWIDMKVNAYDTKFKDKSFDVVICSNTIHHLAYPRRFFEEMNRIIKKGGYLLIQEVNLSIMMKIILRIMNHEGWSYKNDVFGYKPMSDDNDLWSGNNAIPNLLFDDINLFESKFQFIIEEQYYSEFLIFLLSGGVTAKSRTINIKSSLLKIIDSLDKSLVKSFPDYFALQRIIVLKNEK